MLKYTHSINSLHTSSCHGNLLTFIRSILNDQFASKFLEYIRYYMHDDGCSGFQLFNYIMFFFVFNDFVKRFLLYKCGLIGNKTESLTNIDKHELTI